MTHESDVLWNPNLLLSSFISRRKRAKEGKTRREWTRSHSKKYEANFSKVHHQAVWATHSGHFTGL